MKKNIKILCTLGPASLDQRTIARLEALGVDMFRINLSHVEISDLEGIIERIKNYSNKSVCLDTEGAQIRSGNVEKGKIYLEVDALLEITKERIAGNPRRISLNPSFIITKIAPGDLISIDFDSVLLQVVRRNQDSIIAKVVSGGYIGSNKAVTIDRYIKLPVISDKDRQAIRIGLKHDLKYFALSFASSKMDVQEFRKYVGRDAQIISKIESKRGVQNIDGILDVSDAILIDRGDLSREEPIEKIPFIQKLVIKKANARKVPVYVATNLLESMVRSKKPTRAEVNDVVNTLLDGADGLVLAAETAIGNYPITCAVMISKIIKQTEDFSVKPSLKDLQKKDSFFLVEPHGGTLVNRLIDELDTAEIKKYKRLAVDKTFLLSTEQIALGTFSPLEGFMNKEELESVLRNYRLTSGIIWPLPIVLQIKKEQARKLKTGDKVALVLEDAARSYAVLDIEDIYTYDLDRLALETLGTNDPNSFAVQLLKSRGEYFLGGKIDLIKRLPSEYKHYELTPRQARGIFESRGWSRVLGFHTRNVAHRVHEYIQMLAFKEYHCDGLFIHPIIGSKKQGDYTGGIILKSYELLLDKYYAKGKAILAAFQNYSRFSGPREAVFTALCRKNFGCSHFIIGRDHAGIDKYFKPDDAHKLFNYLGDIGIVPIFFNEFSYCKQCDKYIQHCGHSGKDILRISGTQARGILKANRCPPQWFMRKEISDFVLNEIKEGKDVFVR